MQDVRKAVLQTLAHLLGEKEGGEEAPVILVTLVKGNPELQRAAAEGDAVLKLAQSLKHSKCSPRLQVWGWSHFCGWEKIDLFSH